MKTFDIIAVFGLVCLGTSASSARSQTPIAPPVAPPPAKAPDAKSAPAPKAEPSELPPDLQKQLDDALKEIDKLKVPEDAKENLRKRIALRPLTLRTTHLFGMSLQRPLPILVEQLQLPPMQGLALADVKADSPAAAAGLLRYDVLIEVNGKPIPSDVVVFRNDLKDVKPGTDLTFVVVRRGKRETIKGFKLPEAAGPIPPAPPAIPKLEAVRR
jgi:hypothetical protein